MWNLRKKLGSVHFFRIFQIMIAFRTLISDRLHHDQYFWDLQYTSGIRNQWTLRRFQILVLSCIAYDATTFSIAKLSKIPCSDIRYVRVKVTLTVKPIYSLIFLWIVFRRHIWHFFCISPSEMNCARFSNIPFCSVHKRPGQ